MNESPLVSICCFTYNHAEFIRDALDGFMMQRVNFGFEICIFDDASTDDTQKIIREYCDEYPKIFRLCFHKNNLFGTKQWLDSFYEFRSQFKGKYVALCEGDDYWTDPNKLEIQVSFLETHPEYVITAHNAKWKDCETGEERAYSTYEDDITIQAKDVVRNGSGRFPTASFVMRKDMYLMLDESFPMCDVGDWPLQLYAITKGRFYYFNRVMSVYRHMHKGSWSKNVTCDVGKMIIHRLGMIKFIREYDLYTEFRFSDDLEYPLDGYFYSCVYANTVSITEERYQSLLLKSAENDCCLRKVVDNIIDIRALIKDDSCIPHRLQELKGKNLYIFGMGEYSKILTRKMNKAGIPFKGYIVSQYNQSRSFEGLGESSIWTVCNLPDDIENSIVLLALHHKWKNEIMTVLCDCGIKEYVAPFWRED